MRAVDVARSVRPVIACGGRGVDAEERTVPGAALRGVALDRADPRASAVRADARLRP
ncbi:hypothetical protein [Umezawaea sp.]|uniref:hypothetical protein n=1 Tax=Umezawaea sp. TaxID=1955258 RepID=UPI002ED539A3